MKKLLLMSVVMLLTTACSNRSDEITDQGPDPIEPPTTSQTSTIAVPLGN